MGNIIGSTSEASTPGVLGENTNNTPAAGFGVYGKSNAAGVVGESQAWHGVVGHSWSTIGGQGVYGKGFSDNCGVFGESTTNRGVFGKSTTGAGVEGQSEGPGVIGTSTKWIGVYGETAGIENGPAGVWGEHKGAGTGVKAVSKDGVGLAAYSTSNEAIHAETQSPGTAAIAAYNLNPEGTGAAIFAKKGGSQGHAGFFDGNVWVSGELGVGKDIILANADCAEDFDIAEADLIEPGTVMVVGEEGALHQSHQAYDKRVAGVISGAGDYKPGIVLDKQHSQLNRKPIALLGKVFCKVDARYGAIEVGDLLTTSDTPGYAMKATDPLQAFGAVIGKALHPLKAGRGLIPILIALQ
jgi:hypothetical protein